MKNLKRLVISKEGIFADLEGRIVAAEPVGRPVAFDVLSGVKYKSPVEGVNSHTPKGADAYVLGDSIVIPNEPKSNEVYAVQYYRIPTFRLVY